MKKIFLLLGFSFIGLMAFSQQLRFTKGGVAPGKIQTARNYEDFLIGKIKIADENGVEYTLVKALFVQKAMSGKSVSFELKDAYFPQEKRGDIAVASENGSTFSFNNVVVKDKNGKEYQIAAVTYEFTGFR